MQTKNMAYLISKSKEIAALKDLPQDPFIAAINVATEVGVVVPSLFKAALKKNGFFVNEDEDSHKELGYRKFENLYRVLIQTASGNIVAMGASSDTGEAIVHAALGYVREKEIALVGAASNRGEAIATKNGIVR